MNCKLKTVGVVAILALSPFISAHAENLVGMQLGDLVVLNKKLVACTVTKVEPDAITVMSENGVCRLPMEELSPNLQRRFDYNPATAAAYRSRADKAPLLASNVQKANPSSAPIPTSEAVVEKFNERLQKLKDDRQKADAQQSGKLDSLTQERNREAEDRALRLREQGENTKAAMKKHKKKSKKKK